MSHREQELPVQNDRIDAYSTLIRHLENDYVNRRILGIERYGVALQPVNTRDQGRDAYEEWLDLGVYLEALRREHKEMLTLLKEIAVPLGLYDPVTTDQFERIMELVERVG